MPHQRPDTRLHLGDCLPILRETESNTVDLAYVDPPFFTQKVHRLGPRDRARQFSFDDLWESRKEYAEFLYERLQEIHRLISETGSIFLHCDRNAVHVARMLLDDIFGPGNFRSEIIWHYRRWSNSRRGLLPAHQNIIYYTKSDSFTFNEIFTDYSPATNVDQILQLRSRDESNKSVYARDENGKIRSNGAKPGVPLGDVWDIPLLNPKAKERTGYPTQKPLSLLERIIALTTNKGEHVLDPFCGSGTTLVAAQSLERNATGIDASREALDLCETRLETPVRSRSRLLEAGRESYRNADEAAFALLHGVDYVPVQRNQGIDAILKHGFRGSPVTIRVQRPSETIPETADKLVKASAGKGARMMFVIAISRGGCFEFANDLPPGVVLIESPAIKIREQLDNEEDSVNSQITAAIRSSY